MVETKNFIDTTTVRLRKKQLDSLSFTRISKGYLEFNDTLLFSSNNPIISIDTSKIKFVDKDTINVKFTKLISEKENKFGLLFDKKLAKSYKLELLPNAINDIYGFTNDTIKVNFSTRKLTDYGDITLTINNPKNKNLIVQLLTERGDFISEKKIQKSGKLVFKYLNPKKVKVRIIHDKNNNGVWDTGNFLQKIKPENIHYIQKVFELRANWSLNESITIKDDL